LLPSIVLLTETLKMTAKEYNQCVDNFSDNIYRFVLKHLKNQDVAHDVVQDTFAKVWVKHEEISFEKAKSYLFTTAYHTLIDTLRKERYMDEEEKIDTQKSAGPIKDMDLQKILHEALDQLPEIQRSVILLRDYEGYAYDEIGEITGLKESQVKVYIFRARKKLKQILVSIEAVLE
jgi:RNA polymerase sigma factor (sigma-70 family)